MKIEWNDDKSKATISAEDLDKLQGLFQKGYGEGQEKGKKDVLSKLKSLGIEGDDWDAKLTDIAKTLNDVAAGKLVSAEAIKDTDGKLKTLQDQLEKKSAAYETLEETHQEFREEQLVNGALRELAIKNGVLEGAIEDSISSFKRDYQIKIGDDNKLEVTNKQGQQLFDTSKGEPLALDGIYGQFAEAKPWLFKGNGNGGSGSNTPDASGVSLKDLKTDEDKAKYIDDHGLEAYQKLVVGNTANIDFSKPATT